VKKEFGDESIKFDWEITRFQQLRQSAITAVECNDHNLNLLMQYNFHIPLIASRLTPYEAELNFSLIWYDAYRPASRLLSSSMYYEWACILWNIASFESQKGSKICRDTDEGIRLACRHFQQVILLDNKFKIWTLNFILSILGSWNISLH
jgi:hypothetical protein